MNQETLTAEQWNQVGELFDRLVDLPTTERSKLVGENLPAPVRDLLEQMLAAHDSDDPRLLDQTVRAVAGSLFARQIASPSDYCGRRFGPWRALEEIGRGGMAVVLKGERADGQFEKEVAIKLLPHAGSSNEQDRLLKEIRIAARMEHTNIARLIDSGITDDQTPYLVMEYVHGVPVTDYCDSRKLDTAARVQLFLQVIEAVLYAHRLLIVHCDIKPANILVSMDGQVKLVDFGIARMINTPHEMAP
ncbi:MAG: serine/threonine-protein kinase, partial [Wenzhouxiangella sp.]